MSIRAWIAYTFRDPWDFADAAKVALWPAQGMPSEGPRREGGSGASAPASPVPKECAQHQSKDSTP